jgi:hypothetical protein
MAPAALERELLRGMRPDAHRFIRPDWRRQVKPGSDLWSLYERFERKYSPDQPRVPAGAREGGQWTSEDGGGGGGGVGAEEDLSVRIRVAGDVIPICIVEGKAVFSDGAFVVIYRCSDGRTIRRTGSGSFPGIILQPK